MAKKTSSIIESARKAAGREKKEESVSGSTTNNSTGRASSILESARKASDREIKSRPSLWSAQTSPKTTRKSPLVNRTHTFQPTEQMLENSAKIRETNARIKAIDNEIEELDRQYSITGDASILGKKEGLQRERAELSLPTLYSYLGEKPADRESAVNYMLEHGVPSTDASGIMTEQEFGIRNSTDKSYQDYLDNVTRDLVTKHTPRDANFWDLTWNSFKRGYVNSNYGKESYKAMSGFDNKKEEYEEKLAGYDYNFTPNNWFEEMVSGASELLGQQVNQWTDIESLAYAMSLAGMAAAAGQMGPQVALPEEIATVPGAFLVGLQGGSTKQNYEIEAGLAYNEMIESGISPDTATPVAHTVGLVNAALEFLQMDDLVKSSKLLTKTGADDTFRKKLTSYLLKRGGHVLTETAQEVGQESATIAGVNATGIMEGKGPVYNGAEVGQRLWDTGKNSLGSFLLLGTAGDVAGYTTNRAGDAIATEKAKDEYVDAIIKDEASLDAVIESGKESGEATAKVAEKVEQAKARGEVKRGQVKKLVEAIIEDQKAHPTTIEEAAEGLVTERNRTEAIDEINKVLGNEFQWVYFVESGTFKDSDAKYYKRKPTETDARKFRDLQKKLTETGETKYVDELSALREEILGKPMSPSERARIDKVIDNVKPATSTTRMTSGKVNAEALEALTESNMEITVEQVQKVTGFGENGANLVAKLSNRDGVTFSRALQGVKNAYNAGFTDLKTTQVNFESELQKAAFEAGKVDRGVQDRLAQANAKNATIYDGTFTENEYTKNFTEAEKKMISTYARELGMDISVVDRIIANVVDDVEYEANASHLDGKMEISANRNVSKVISRLVLHEGGHRMKQLAPTEFGVLMNALYARSVRENSKMGLSETADFDYVKAEHDNAGITLDTSGYFEEIAVRELETIFSSAEEFNKWYAEISGNKQAQTAWQKFVNYIKDILAKLKRYIDTAKMSPEDRAKAKARFNELKLFENAFKAAENVVEQKNSITNSGKNLEIKTNKEYNGNKKYSMKSTYNEYNTIGMQWAYDAETKIGDLNLLFNTYTGEYVLVEATKEDVGFIELKAGKYKHLRKDLEVYESKNQRNVDRKPHRIGDGQNNNTRNNVDAGNRETGKRNAEISPRKSDSDQTTDTKTTDGNLSKKNFSLKDSDGKTLSADNVKPTSNPDINFSLKESVEETKDLIAVHNLNTEQLSDAIIRGQFVMPSVAVTNKGHTSFGDISVVFNKNTIDPTVDNNNKLYGSDAWTPTQTRLKKNPVFDNNAVTSRVKAIKQTIGGGYSQIFDVSDVAFKHTITKADGSIYDAFSNNIGLQTAYALENSLIDKVPKTKNGRIDQALLKEQLNEKLDNDNTWRNYKKWLGAISDEIITSYDTATNEEILNNMKAQPDTAKTFRVSINGELTVPAVEYNSIDDYRANKSRLSENAEEMASAVGKEFVDWAKNVQAKTNVRLNNVVNAINSSFNNRYNANDIVRNFASNNISVTKEDAITLQNLYKKAVELPTPYFEAKPRRAVGLNEIAMVVLPNNASQEIKSLLDEKGISYKQYDVGSKQSRTDAVNSVEGVRFSLKDSDTNKLSTEEKNVVDSLGKGAKVATNKNGDMLIATNKDKSTVMYSLKTYNDGGKEALEKALRANGHTEEEIKNTLSYVDDAADYLTILASGYAKSHNYNALSDHLIADVITNVKTGKQVISSIVNNGEYPVNIDLALICKKRVAYMNLMNRLIDDGIFDKVNYGGEAIAKVNGLLRADGFETACLGCFVESRRLQFQSWAETIVSEWNAEVDKRTKGAGNFNFADGKAILTDADMDALAEELKNAGKKNAQGNLNLGRGSVQTKMGRLLDKVPSLRKHLTVADLLKPNGLTALRAYDSNLFSIVKSRYGAASPKIVQDYNPYASEIAMLTFSSVKSITSNAVKGADSYRRKVTNEMGGKPVKQKGETTKEFNARKAEFNAKVEDEAIRRYLYDIGGARIQSFSDFMIENVFDYIQIFADLSAKRLPLHGYTKEIVALRLFGMTGAKWNGSWIAHVDRSMGKEYAGLLPASEAKNGNAILVHTKDGDYAIGFDDYARYKASNKKTFIQSIGMKDMIALQLDHRYSPYVGSITIGVSDKQILAMLDSPLFRFVIPYHSSGMLPQFAKLVGVDLYNDYQDYQNTTVKEWFDAYGNPCEPIRDAKNEVIKVDTSYNFNAEFQKTGDAKKATDNYLKWCEQKHPVYDSNKKRVGYVTFNPKFSNSPYGTDFSKHENYYKMLEDFNSYDNITEEPAVQGAVTMNFPSEANRLTASEMKSYKARLRETGIFSEQEIEKYSAIADKTFKELIADEVKGRAEYQKAQTPKWENTVKNVEEMLLADHKRSTQSNSLMGGLSGTEIRNAIKSNNLSKYVEDGTISTEKYQELVKTYGAIPAGENPSRDITVPKKTAKDKKVSQTVRTILEAKATPDEVLPTIEKMVEDGVFSYETYTDKQAIADAEDYLKEYGWDESLADWFDDVEKGVVSKQHTAMGWALYDNAVNTATTTTSATEKTTAMKTSLNILDAMVRHQRNAAQALQATRILKKLSPETQLYAVQKSVSAFQKELTDKYGKKAPNLKINEELAEQFLTAESAEERAEIENEIYKDIGRQMPSRFIDKWNAWRYLAMLGNARTHVRNIFGNAFFAPVVGVKNLTATAIESAVQFVADKSGKKFERGKAFIFGNKADRALLSAAWSDYSNVADIVSNGGKYNDSAMANKSIEEGRQIFKFKPLEWARKKNSQALETEDVWFSQPHYAYALAQYCKAHNITAEQIVRGKAIAPAREYAIKEAQKATYKDTNSFSQFVSELGRSGGKKSGVKKVASTVIEGILPFRKTPANILVRGVEYSPIGLLKSLSVDLVKVAKGKMSATEAIDNISAGLTGTGLVALGVLLAAQGLLRGHGEDEDKEKKFKEMQGHQAYSLELPNGASVTLDWLAPEALPFFVGVNIWETATSTKEDLNFATILQSVTHITEPMLEMSCLQGLNDLLDSIGYASSNDTSGLVSVVSSAATSYLMQGLPTIFGQAERTSEEERMTTYTEKNNFLTGDMQYALGKASAKIPFWDYNQIPYIDAWGRKEASGSALKRAGHNFLNPAYTSTIVESKTEKELLRLYEQTGDGGVFPSRADKYFKVDGVRKDLTANEYVDYATKKGQKSLKTVTDLVNSKAYNKLSDTEKAEAIKDAYTYADQKAKEAVSNYKPDSWVSKADKFSNVGNFISFRTEVSSTKESNGGKISKEEVVDIVIDMAKNDSEMWNMYLSEYESKGDKYVHDMGIDGEDYMNFLIALDKYDRPNENGNLGTYTNEEYENAIRSMRGLSRQEKAILWQSKNPDGSTKNNPWK